MKGCEIDWLGEENIEWAENLIREGDFDFTIGSVHFLEKWGFDYCEDWEKGFKKFKNTTSIIKTPQDSDNDLTEGLGIEEETLIPTGFTSSFFFLLLIF